MISNWNSAILYYVRRLGGALTLAICLLSLPACGFKPLYAVNEEVGALNLSDVYLLNVAGDKNAVLSVSDAMRLRTNAEADEARYDLIINTDESAARLGIQLDASVTRFSYRLMGEYKLRDKETKRVITGSTQANASFNVVNSQYSTIAAERDARRKAAVAFADLLERDILLKIARPISEEKNDEGREPYFEKPFGLKDAEIEEGTVVIDDQRDPSIDFIGEQTLTGENENGFSFPNEQSFDQRIP